MSAQFGRWNWEGQPAAPDYIERVNVTLAPYGPDGNEAYSKDGVDILYRAFHTTKESHREKQPHVSFSGVVITWDGRLDNRDELIRELLDSTTISSTDVAIVAVAYERWGTNSFAKLVGDWALSIWDPNTRSLILAKDPIGTRHLYYATDKKQITWASILDPLVLFAGRSLAICEEYIAGWLSGHHPAADLTPYVGIHSVPPSSSVVLRIGKRSSNKYWDFDPGKRIRYRIDAEYEEHFRSVFGNAVQRRLRSDRPVLAHLSGGMDSSSIVCMADTVIARGHADTPRLDTISWHDDSNPGLDERPYFTKVEEKRGRVGFHINLAALRQLEGREDRPQEALLSALENHQVLVTPYASSIRGEFLQRYASCLASGGYRITLSGVAGDEVMGSGVPTPRPELQNLLATARLFRLAHQVNAWAVKMRKARLSLIWEAARGFFMASLVGLGFSEELQPAPWLLPKFVRGNWRALRGYPSRMNLFGSLPSFQNHIAMLNVLRRILAFLVSQTEALVETRYPYLDRYLLEFMYALPPEQIVRLGQRRSLMKRSLVGIVPNELINRRQKAVVRPAPQMDISVEYLSLTDIGNHIVSGSIGIVDSNRFLEALQRTRRKEDVPGRSLMRTLALESWLRHLKTRGILNPSEPIKSRSRSSTTGGISARSTQEIS